MHVEVNGTRLWFDVEGPSLVPEGDLMRERPTVVLVHGGPGTYDHSYFKPYFGALTDHAQIVYVDLRDHGRSARHDPGAWTFEACADDIRAFCDAMGIARPIVYGHSMGGFVVMLYGARHPGHAAGLILQSTMARFDLERVVEDFRRVAGDLVAERARRAYAGDDVTDHEWASVFEAFGPHVQSDEELARRVKNLDVGAVGMDLLRNYDIVDRLAAITSPTLVCVGDRDPVTSVAAAEEIVGAIPPGIARLEVVEGAGHMIWLDDQDGYWPRIAAFVDTVAGPALQPS